METSIILVYYTIMYCSSCPIKIIQIKGVSNVALAVPLWLCYRVICTVLFGSFGLSTKEPYTIMLYPSSLTLALLASLASSSSVHRVRHRNFIFGIHMHMLHKSPSFFYCLLSCLHMWSLPVCSKTRLNPSSLDAFHERIAPSGYGYHTYLVPFPSSI